MKETPFDNWHFDNWDTLVEMYEQFIADCPNADVELHEFTCDVYDNAQDVVEDWPMIQKQTMIQKQRYKNN